MKPQRPTSPVAALLIQQAWRLRLWISGFRDLENPDDPDGPLDGWREQPARFRDHAPGEDKGIAHQARAEGRAEYYRRLAIESHRQPPPLGPGRGRGRRRLVVGGLGVFPIKRAVDRKIIRLLAEGTPIRDVMSRLHVGQDRVYRVLRNVHNRIAKETKNGKATGQ